MVELMSATVILDQAHYPYTEGMHFAIETWKKYQKVYINVIVK